MFGAAWTGETEVTEVPVSTNGGQTWAEADFVMLFNGIRGDVGNLIGLRRRSRGNTPCCPVQNANGEIQPDKHDQNYATYVINHLLPIEVIVGDPWSKSHLSPVK